MSFYTFWHSIWSAMLGYIFYYPLFMSTLWIIGAIFFYFKNEKHNVTKRIPDLRPGESWEGASILIPCYNEGLNVKETVAFALNVDYPEFEVIAINDGSKDETLSILLEISRENPRLKVVNLASNQGKAVALQSGAAVAKYEHLICIDGDALIDPYCVHWMVKHFIRYPEVAAVTGNPRIRNRTSLLGKIQVGEFSSIVGMIKRAQRIYGRLFTVSGVVTGFRKSAVHEVGYWSPDMLTEDIDVTWKLQRNGWDVRFEPHALVWILMPETLKGLWKQRLRWAMGGIQVILKNARVLFHSRQTHLWGLMIEQFLSLIWSYSMIAVVLVWLVNLIHPVPYLMFSDSPIIPHETSVILIGACLIQFGISKWLDGHYDKGLGKNYFWMIWYPFAFWLINLLTTVTAVPRVLFMKQKRARWVSPDRGVHQAVKKPSRKKSKQR